MDAYDAIANPNRNAKHQMKHTYPTLITLLYLLDFKQCEGFTRSWKTQNASAIKPLDGLDAWALEVHTEN